MAVLILCTYIISLVVSIILSNHVNKISLLIFRFLRFCVNDIIHLQMLNMNRLIQVFVIRTYISYASIINNQIKALKLISTILIAFINQLRRRRR